MAHQHDHSGHTHSHSHTNNAGENIKVAFFLNFFFCIIELVGGILTNSVAIMSDALHDFGDSLSLGLAWYFQKLSGKKGDNRFSYGYKRFSLLGALINSVVLLVGSFFVINMCIHRLIEPQEPNAKGMLILAVFGIIVNGAAVLRLQKGSSLNERTVSLHLLEDVLGWAAVLIAGIVMMFVDFPILDPILSLCITAYILSNIYKNLRDTMRVILQGTPDNVNREEVEDVIRSTPGVIDFHDLHLWTMDGEYAIMTVHIIVANNIDTHKLKCDLRKKLLEKHIQHPTLEFESENESCEFCEECR